MPRSWRRRRLILPAAILLAGLTFAAVAALAAGTTTYYFAASGSDSNPCTQSQPCKSLAKIQSLALNPGDAVALERGDTWTGGLVISRSGSSAARITFTGYGTASTRPKISGGLNGDCVKLTGSFITVDNLETDACGYAGVDVFGTDTTVQGSAASGNAVGLRQAGNTANVVFTGNTLANNNILNQNTSSGSSGAFGVLLNGPAVVTNNTITGSDAASIAYGRDGSAVELFNAGNAWIHNNVMTNDNAGVEAGGTNAGAAIEYNAISSNTSSDTQPTGVVWQGSAGKLWLSHNSIDLVGSSGQGVVCYGGCTSDTTITSNAIKASQKALYVDSSTPTVTGNVLNGPVQTGAALGASNSTAAIGWVSPPGDLHEQASSPTVDHATVTNFASDLDGLPVPDVAGSASDAGAYEFQSGGGTTSTTSTTTTSTTTSTTTTPTTSTTTSTTTTTPPPPGQVQHVVVVVMENQSAGILSQMPYLNGLANANAKATAYYAIGHFSADNYIAMTSGTTCCFDDSFQRLNVTNIFGQLGSAAQTLSESGGGGYAGRHDPQTYYGFPSSSGKYTDGQSTDLTGKKFTLVVPGLCDDMHDCGASTGDGWLSRNVPKLMATPNTLVIVTFDEGSGGSQGATTPPANNVPFVMASNIGGVAHGTDGTQFTHYSLLRTVEGLFGLPCAGSACSAASMIGHFGL